MQLLLKKENVGVNTILEVFNVEEVKQLESDKSSLESEDEVVHESKEKLKVSRKVNIDWALKKEWVIVSLRDFEWCTSQSSMGETEALSKFSRGLEMSQGENVKEEFDQALMYWVYPASSRPPSHVKEISKIIGESSKTKNQDWEYYKECLQEWYI